jgi:hypothetical protein
MLVLTRLNYELEKLDIFLVDSSYFIKKINYLRLLLTVN